MGSGEQLDQGRLPTTILAQQSMNFAAEERKRHIVIGYHAGKNLRDLAQLPKCNSVRHILISRAGVGTPTLVWGPFLQLNKLLKAWDREHPDSAG
jgi:hypothetical protein